MRYMLKVIGRKRFLVNLSYRLAALQARFLEVLPEPLLTRDQVELLKRDNVVDQQARALEDLGISPTPIETIVPQYLARYRHSPTRVARS
jgi:NADH dehydrogenase